MNSIEAAQIKAAEYKKWRDTYSSGQYYEVKFIRLKTGKKYKVCYAVDAQLNPEELRAKIQQWIQGSLKGIVDQENLVTKERLRQIKENEVIIKLKDSIVMVSEVL